MLTRRNATEKRAARLGEMLVEAAAPVAAMDRRSFLKRSGLTAGGLAARGGFIAGCSENASKAFRHFHSSRNLPYLACNVDTLCWAGLIWPSSPRKLDLNLAHPLF